MGADRPTVARANREKELEGDVDPEDEVDDLVKPEERVVANHQWVAHDAERELGRRDECRENHRANEHEIPALHELGHGVEQAGPHLVEPPLQLLSVRVELRRPRTARMRAAEKAGWVAFAGGSAPPPSPSSTRGQG